MKYVELRLNPAEAEGLAEIAESLIAGGLLNHDRLTYRQLVKANPKERVLSGALRKIMTALGRLDAPTQAHACFLEREMAVHAEEENATEAAIDRVLRQAMQESP